MAREQFFGITFDQLTTTVEKVCGTKGLHSVAERQLDGYQNGDRYLILLGSDAAKNVQPVVVITHENNILDDMSGTPRPHELVAPRQIIREVKKTLKK